MDLSTIVLGVLFTIAIILPFWLIQASINKRKKEMKKLLESFGAQTHLDVSDNEIWNMNALAVDSIKSKLVFICGNGLKKQEQIIDLKEVFSCKISKESVGKAGSEAFKIVKVDLIFNLKNGEGVKSISLFDVLYDDPVEGGMHLEIAKRWQARINEWINRPDRTLRAA